MERIEHLILEYLLHDEDYVRKVEPFIKSEYFKERSERLLYEKFSEFFIEYNSLPTKEALEIELDNDTNINESDFDDITGVLQTLRKPAEVDAQWLLDNTENFCQENAVYNGVMESISILDGEHSTKDKGAIPEILSDALGVSFDSNIGHDFLEDADGRYEFYHRVEEKIPFDIEYLNKTTNGGLANKTLNILMAGPGVGKTMVMTHMAANNLVCGKNVLYITMEMAEERIAERIDANLLNIPLDELATVSKDMYDKKVEKVRAKTSGKLIVKEYPTAQAGVGHFRHLLNEMKLKKDFVPDIIYIDYLNICISTRVKNSQANSYTIVKSIAEEIRGLAVERGVPIVSATQTNREGFNNSDVDLTNTSESFGLPATADWMVAIIKTEELEELGQVMIKQLKNRYGDLEYYNKFVVGIDRTKMRLFDVEQGAQTVDDKPVMDSTGFGERADEDDKMGWATKKKGRKDFSGFNV